MFLSVSKAKVNPAVHDGNSPTAKKSTSKTSLLRLAFHSVFGPNEIPTRLILPTNLFSSIGETVLVNKARSESLAYKCSKSDPLVLTLEDATTAAAATSKMVIKRKFNGEPGALVFHIYSTSPIYTGKVQVTCTTPDNDNLYPLADICYQDSSSNFSGKKPFVVTMKGTQEQYTIHKSGGIRGSSTALLIKMNGTPVASTHAWEKGVYMLEVNSGLDASLMLCLAAIGHDMDKDARKFE